MKTSSAPIPWAKPEYTVVIPHWLPSTAEIMAAMTSTMIAAPGLRMIKPPNTPPSSQIPVTSPPNPGNSESIALYHAPPRPFQTQKINPVATPKTAAVIISTTRHRRAGRAALVFLFFLTALLPIAGITRIRFIRSTSFPHTWYPHGEGKGFSQPSIVGSREVLI